MMKNKFITFAFIFLVSTGFVFAAFDFSGGVSDSGETSFETGGGAPLCVLTEGDSARWQYNDKDDIIILADGVTPDTVTSGNGCSMDSGLPNSICCPIGYECNLNSGACDEERNEVVTCADYDGAGNEDSCESANVASIQDSIYQVFLFNLETELGAGSLDIPAFNDLAFCDSPQIFTLDGKERIFGACGCVWDSIEASCESSYRDVLKEAEPVGDGPFYKCITDLDPLQDKCDTDGVYSVEWTAERIEINKNGARVFDSALTGGSVPDTSDCVDGGPIEFECLSESSLPFFTMMNFLVASLAIALMYLFFRKKF
jgi:hypothetical protein